MIPVSYTHLDVYKRQPQHRRRSAPNEKAQILDVDGEPIPNLYSSGEFGSIWAAKYQGSGNITECMVFGRIAARELIAKE